MPALAQFRQWARAIRRDVHALYLASRDPRVPWLAKVIAMSVAAYALSPIDLIPDFIPVLGQLDDMILVPLGIWLATSLVPPPIMAEHRATALAAQARPRSMGGAIVILAIWLVLTAALGWFVYRRFAA